jgi:hypothetical protein
LKLGQFRFFCRVDLSGGKAFHQSFDQSVRRLLVLKVRRSLLLRQPVGAMGDQEQPAVSTVFFYLLLSASAGRRNWSGFKKR